MPKITLKSDGDLRLRHKDIRIMLRPISRALDGPAWSQRIFPYGVILAVHDGSPPSSDYRDWRFATRVQGCKASYFELWRRTEGRSLYLDRAYLHIYRTLEHSNHERESLLLHCDPEEPLNGDRAEYKCGPHIHMSFAGDPLSHSHVSLHSGYLPKILASLRDLTDAMSWAVRMINFELLEALSKIQ
jgi:hypothetical protein